MNLEAKEWSQPHSPPTTQQYQSAADHHYAQTYPQGPLMHPPISQPTANFLPLGKSDGALPGMASQPTTPRPTAHSPPDRANSTGSYTFHTQPYPSVMARKRGRSDGALFTAAETGPFFSSTKSCDNLYALDRSSLLSVRIQAKFDRGFFLADNDWTCYRRNYFQVSGAFSIHGLSHYYGEHEWQCLVQVDGALYPVQRFLLGLSARVSNSDKKIELVQHTPKRDKGPQMTPMPKAITPGGNLGLSTVGANQSIVTFERIQFKTATANNGKRRAAQQYYVCLMELFAETDKGVQVKVATCQSAPLVVRGRSPGHYSDSHERYEVPLAASMPPLPPTQQTAPPPPPPPPSQSAPQHLPPVSDDRFAFPRPPVTPPNMVPPTSEYSYPYYSSYPSFAPPPPPPPPALSMVMHGNPQPPATPNTSSPSRQYPYMVPSMSSDPSSSETSSPDMYTGEFVHHPATPTEHAPHQGIAIHPSPMEGEWNRQRYNSAPSSSGHDYYPPPPPPALPSPTAQAHYRGNTKYPA